MECTVAECCREECSLARIVIFFEKKVDFARYMREKIREQLNEVPKKRVSRKNSRNWVHGEQLYTEYIFSFLLGVSALNSTPFLGVLTGLRKKAIRIDNGFSVVF